MKKTILSLILLIMILALAACQGSASTATSDNANGGGPPDGEAQEIEMSTEMTLVLGTVKLDETEYAIDAEQAAEFLPLWKAYRSLSDSDTAAQEELDALVDQIGETMTSEQTKAIEDMDLSMQDMNGVMQTLGVETNMGGFGAMDADMQETMEAARASGDFPGGGPGGDMGGMGGGPGGDMGGMGGGPGGGFGGEMDSSARETAMAENGGAQGGRFGINSTMLDAIIEFLEAKIQ